MSKVTMAQGTEYLEIVHAVEIFGKCNIQGKLR